MGDFKKLKDEANKLVNQGKQFIYCINESPSLDFQIEYETWYSLACRLVDRIMPERLYEFKLCYSNPAEKINTYTMSSYFLKIGNYHIPFRETIRYYADKFNKQLSILVGVVSCIDSSILDIRNQVYYEFQENEIAVAKEVIKINPRASGIIARVVIEKHLKNISEKRSIMVKSKYTNPGLADYILTLRNEGVIQETEKKKLDYLKEIGNKCAHDKGAEPKEEEVQELINGANWCISTIIG